MKNALIAAVVAAVVAAGSAGATLAHPSLQVRRVIGPPASVPANSHGFAWASCPGNLKAVGGGLVGVPFSETPIEMEGSYPLPSDATWQISVLNENSIPTTVNAVVTCVG